MRPPTRLGTLRESLLLTLLVVGVAGFILYAGRFGWAGLSGGLTFYSRIFTDRAPLTNGGIFLHMITGAAITGLVALQLAGPLRRRLPGLHRALGYLIVALSVATALGGFVYIATKGTVGGWPMSAAFALYGALMLLAAIQTLRHARARRLPRHRDWALRLFVLAIASWLYRVHYGVMFGFFDGAGTNADFTGWFDRANLLAFFLPYLAFVEWHIRRRGDSMLDSRGQAG